LFWKSIRDFLERYRENKSTRVKQILLDDPVFQQFDAWLKTKDESYLHKSIVELRKLFLQEVKLSS